MKKNINFICVSSGYEPINRLDYNEFVIKFDPWGNIELENN